MTTKFVLIGLAMFVTACAQPQVASQGAELDPLVTAAVAPYLEARDFMGVVGVQQADGPPYLAAFGKASLELNVAHASDSAFLIGSVSKQFTAVAILLLEQDGKLDTGDRVALHLPDFPHGNDISIEQLLTHTAGVADVYSLALFGASYGQADDFAAIIGALGALPLTMEPGAGFSYSNGGYSVLAAIIEEVSGMPYGEFLQQRVFGPLGMSNTYDDAPGPAHEHQVTGYDPWGARALMPTTAVSSAFLRGSGSLWSTAGDMLRWSHGLHSGQVLDAERYAKFTKDYGEGYGFGVSVFKRFGRDTIGHDGRVAGFSSDLAYYIDADTTIVVLGNVQSSSRDWIRRDVAAAVFGEVSEAPAPRPYANAPDDLSTYQGTFSFFPGFNVFTEVFDETRLMARANQGGWSELVPLEDGSWFSRMLYTTVRFESDDDGQVRKLIWGAGDGAPVGERIAGQ